MITLIKEILQSKNHHGEKSFSQARVYLFLSLLFYFVVLLFLSIKANKDIIVNIDAEKAIISALQWIILLFAVYSFGGKAIDILNFLTRKKEKFIDDITRDKTATKKPAIQNK